MVSGTVDREYIGDGVYVAHDGYSIWLSTVRTDPEIEHYIALEPGVLTALNDYATRMRAKAS